MVKNARLWLLVTVFVGGFCGMSAWGMGGQKAAKIAASMARSGYTYIFSEQGTWALSALFPVSGPEGTLTHDMVHSLINRMVQTPAGRAELTKKFNTIAAEQYRSMCVRRAGKSVATANSESFVQGDMANSLRPEEHKQLHNAIISALEKTGYIAPRPQIVVTGQRETPEYTRISSVIHPRMAYNPDLVWGKREIEAAQEVSPACTESSKSSEQQEPAPKTVWSRIGSERACVGISLCFLSQQRRRLSQLQRDFALPARTSVALLPDNLPAGWDELDYTRAEMAAQNPCRDIRLYRPLDISMECDSGSEYHPSEYGIGLSDPENESDTESESATVYYSCGEEDSEQTGGNGNPTIATDHDPAPQNHPREHQEHGWRCHHFCTLPFLAYLGYKGWFWLWWCLYYYRCMSACGKDAARNMQCRVEGFTGPVYGPPYCTAHYDPALFPYRPT